jgi:hypothetical protein
MLPAAAHTPLLQKQLGRLKLTWDRNPAVLLQATKERSTSHADVSHVCWEC